MPGGPPAEKSPVSFLGQATWRCSHRSFRMWRQARKAFQSMRRWQAPLFRWSAIICAAKPYYPPPFHRRFRRQPSVKPALHRTKPYSMAYKPYNAGNADTVLVGGVEKSSNSPHILGVMKQKVKNAMRGNLPLYESVAEEIQENDMAYLAEMLGRKYGFRRKIWMNMLTKVWRKPAMHSNPAVYRRRYCRSSMTREHFPSTKQCRTIPYSVMSNMQNHCF